MPSASDSSTNGSGGFGDVQNPNGASATGRRSGGQAGALTTSAQRTIAPTERLAPGWDQRAFKYGIGFSSSFMSGSSTFVLDRFSNDSSFSFFFGLNKSTDSFTASDSTAGSGTSTITTTTTRTLSGTKNPYAISLGASYNKALVRQEWLLVRAGLFAGVDYYTDASYDVGTQTTSYSSADPTTVTVTETNYGSATASRRAVIKAGPVVDAFVLLRWFPQLAIGLQGGILYSTPGQTDTKTETRTRTYQRINGVDQTPTSSTTSNATSSAQTGPLVSTFAVAGQTFNLFGSFVLRYVW